MNLAPPLTPRLFPSQMKIDVGIAGVVEFGSEALDVVPRQGFDADGWKFQVLLSLRPRP
jgi:hypothetical protein